MDYHTVECGTVLCEQSSIVSHETYAVFSLSTPRKGSTSVENLVDLDFTHHHIITFTLYCTSTSTVEAILVREGLERRKRK